MKIDTGVGRVKYERWHLCLYFLSRSDTCVRNERHRTYHIVLIVFTAPDQARKRSLALYEAGIDAREVQFRTMVRASMRMTAIVWLLPR